MENIIVKLDVIPNYTGILLPTRAGVRFDFVVPEDLFLLMCEVANVDPRHPKLGWKGEGHGWSPTDAESYYSLFCDYGMTDPATGEWSPHRPVGYINEKGEREFRLPDNYIEIIQKGLDRYTKQRTKEDTMVDDAINTFAEAMVEQGRLTEEQVAEINEKHKTRFSLTDAQATAVIEAMKANAEIAPQLELTPENWVAEFGADGVVATPIGEVKMSANQYQKMGKPDRRTKLGMVKPTLTNPDVIIEEASKPKDGRVAERNSSYIFVKAFTNTDGTRDYMFTSVSNLRDGIEIVMSNQEKETPRIKRLLKEGKLAYINKATLPSKFTASAQGDQSTIPSEVSYSDNKDTTTSPNNQTKEQKTLYSLITPQMDADYLSAVERGDMEMAQKMVNTNYWNS